MPKKRAAAKTKPVDIIPDFTPSQRNTEAAKRWLWIWVSFFTIIIIGLWAWATKISLSTFRWNKTPEKKLLQTSKDDWDTLFNQENDRIKNEQLKKQLKNIVNQIISQSVTTTPSSTATISSTVSNTSTQTTSTTSTP